MVNTILNSGIEINQRTTLQKLTGPRSLWKEYDLGSNAMLTEEGYKLTQLLEADGRILLGALSSISIKGTIAAFKTIYSSNDLNCDSRQNNPLVLRDAGSDKSQTGHEWIMKLKDPLYYSLNLLTSLDFYNKQKHYKLKT